MYIWGSITSSGGVWFRNGVPGPPPELPPGIDCFAERSQGGHGRKSWCFKWRNHGVFLVKTIWVRVSVPNEFYIVLCFHFGEHLGGSVLTKISLDLEMLSHQLVKRHGLGSVFGSHCCLRWIPAHRNRYCSMFLEYSSEQGLALADIPNSWYDWKDIFFSLVSHGRGFSWSL